MSVVGRRAGEGRSEVADRGEGSPVPVGGERVERSHLWKELVTELSLVDVSGARFPLEVVCGLRLLCTGFWPATGHNIGYTVASDISR